MVEGHDEGCAEGGVGGEVGEEGVEEGRREAESGEGGEHEGLCFGGRGEDCRARGGEGGGVGFAVGVLAVVCWVCLRSGWVLTLRSLRRDSLLVPVISKLSTSPNILTCDRNIPLIWHQLSTQQAHHKPPLLKIPTPTDQL